MTLIKRPEEAPRETLSKLAKRCRRGRIQARRRAKRTLIHFSLIPSEWYFGEITCKANYLSDNLVLKSNLLLQREILSSPIQKKKKKTSS